MINHLKGDLIQSGAGIIAHQVNCKGKMGSGVALAIRKAFPNVYQRYISCCEDYKRVYGRNYAKELLGKSQPVSARRFGKDVVIVNMFAQDNFGYNGAQYTDYESLRKCLFSLRRLAVIKNCEKIALPYKIGCARGGGDWDNVVYPMIEEVFADSGIDIDLYEWRDEAK